MLKPLVDFAIELVPAFNQLPGPIKTVAVALGLLAGSIVAVNVAMGVLKGLAATTLSLIHI